MRSIEVLMHGLNCKWKYRDIAKAIGCHECTVRRYVNKYPELKQLAKPMGDRSVIEAAQKGDQSLNVFMGWMRLVHAEKAKEMEVYVANFKKRF